MADADMTRPIEFMFYCSDALLACLCHILLYPERLFLTCSVGGVDALRGIMYACPIAWPLDTRKQRGFQASS